MAAAEQMAAEVAGQSETEGETEPTVHLENAELDQAGEPEKKKQKTWMRIKVKMLQISVVTLQSTLNPVSNSNFYEMKMSISIPESKYFFVNKLMIRR